MAFSRCATASRAKRCPSSMAALAASLVFCACSRIPAAFARCSRALFRTMCPRASSRPPWSSLWCPLAISALCCFAFSPTVVLSLLACCRSFVPVSSIFLPDARSTTPLLWICLYVSISLAASPTSTAARPSSDVAASFWRRARCASPSSVSWRCCAILQIRSAFWSRAVPSVSSFVAMAFSCFARARIFFAWRSTWLPTLPS
mmetsp:Transcript_35348/g.85355  ORF Transcript_35348/g.85355 Transcript_35348/m.85355 type:complete len:203 (+) Transcript_35348:176-784(+)